VLLLDGGALPDKEFIGGKAWSLARMQVLGLRVPPAFVLPVSECRAYHDNGRILADEVWRSVLKGVGLLEEATGRRFGSGDDPLLVSVRSGAAVSMPGMMDTVLNLGMTDEVEAALARGTGDATYAADTRARFCHQFGEIVLKADLDPYEAGTSAKQICEEVRHDTGREIPRDPAEQLRAAICAVFDSWESPRARSYRRHWGIPHEGGTAVTVQAMVFGNLGDRSGTGVLFTRNPLSGEPEPYGEWLRGGQGDDVVGGAHAVRHIDSLGEELPHVYEELVAWARMLEREQGDVQDIEFTVERGRLYLLQSRSAKRSPDAAVRIAADLVSEGVLTPEEALRRVTPEQVSAVLLPRLEPAAVHGATILAKGEPACPGVACGTGVVDPDEAVRRAAEGEQVVLVRPTTSPVDVHGMIAAVAVVTELGGATSHAAVVTRALGRPSVVGVGHGVVEAGLAGRLLTVDGGSGTVYEGRLRLHETCVADHPALSRLAEWAKATCPVPTVEEAPDGVGVLDLDTARIGLETAGAGPDMGEVAAAMRGAGAVTGAVLASPEGARAVLRAGVPLVVARPALPTQLRLIEAAAEG
jgi:pyruvate,orthophosphate dikinase